MEVQTDLGILIDMGEYPLVTPRYEREPDSVPGAFYVVKEWCLLCALPPEAAPENISWDEAFQKGGCVGCPSHCRVEHQPRNDDELAVVIEVAAGSCVEAIRYCGTDPEVLQRFRELGLEHLCDAL